jgi:ABC-type nickel/cobalt efflux system permease component RcnA
MTYLPDLLQNGATNVWLFIPTAILLGALHGLEPGHSKTIMAAFIVAIRGTVAQAVLLGLSAALSHTAVVWVVALGGQALGRNFDVTAKEPWLQMASAVIIAGVAVWIIARTRGEQIREAAHHHVHHHTHGHDHDHHHDHPHDHDHDSAGDYRDAHEQAHADAISRRFAHRTVTTGQIVLFGLTGGLVPCPAAITVLLLCLQLKRLVLGVLLVGCFSIGLAFTMVAVGVAASLGIRHMERRWTGFATLARRAPYASGALMLLIALYIGLSGWIKLSA